MNDEKRNRLLEEYANLQKLIEQERVKRFCQQDKIDEYEDKMAAIETRFQKDGDDIRTYL